MPKAMMTRDQASASNRKAHPRREAGGEPIRSVLNASEPSLDEAVLAMTRALSIWSEQPEDQERARAALLETEAALRRIDDEIRWLSHSYDRATTGVDVRSTPATAPREAGSSGVRASSRPPKLPSVARRIARAEGPSRESANDQSLAVTPTLSRSGKGARSAARLEDTLRIPLAVPTTPRPRQRWPMIAAGIALLSLFGLIALSIPSAPPPAPVASPQTTAAKEREPTLPAQMATALPTALPAALPTPQAASAPQAPLATWQPTNVLLESVDVIWGRTSRPALVQALRRSFRKMERCFAKKPQEASALGPTTGLTLRLRRNGSVRWVDAGASAPADGCIVRSIYETRFPSADVGLLAKAELRLGERAP